MDSLSQSLLDAIYAPKEGARYVEGWFSDLKQKGLDPLYITMDGEQSTMKTFQRIWPGIKIQRCLFHIRREGTRWLRSRPKTEAGKKLKKLLSTLTKIKSIKERNYFIAQYKKWITTYKDFACTLPKTSKANVDLMRTMVLIDNALPNMFHYLMDPNIRPTSNVLESFYSRLKPAYRQHRGLTQRHKIQFLKWYCYYENQQKINNP